MSKGLRTGIIIGGVVLVLLILLPLLLGGLSGWQRGSWGMMGPGWGMMGGFGWGWFMPVLMVLFWGLIIWGIVALVRGLNNRTCCDSSATNSALDVLKKRYAQGEIGKKEYEEKKKDLV
jgi:putative membrane protein